MRGVVSTIAALFTVSGLCIFLALLQCIKELDSDEVDRVLILTGSLALLGALWAIAWAIVYHAETREVK